MKRGGGGRGAEKVLAMLKGGTNWSIITGRWGGGLQTGRGGGAREVLPL